ncbi:protein ALP1-like [Dioscorea cayenensis subsp. rotundata]|uniref:Protein ALP1-like n=1 Tax=Dioscorea cayennensis subsp. rotundata TaxID=55577 RepID=A0AB40BJH1_DIOCR|nr:protein ALP1-like [Dioscorea cayenensis subsp. rotundata]
MTVEEQLLMFLHTIGHNQRNRVIAHNFLRSSETVSRYFHHVLFAIGELQHDYIRPPSMQTHPYIEARRTLYPYFKDCIGALDGTHIHASVPANEVVAFRGRKSYPTQNVLAAVDFDLCFTYVLAGWEGSAYDALVLRDALERPNGLRVPEGKYYLVDAGYATRPGFIPPYRGVRYHLKDFGSRTPQNAKELFNLRHSSARTSVERAFGSLKGRFKILSSRPFFPFKTQAELVLACCVLHNYIISGGEDEFIPSEEDWIPQRNSQGTAREQREEAQEWAARRDEIASEMWSNN